MRARLRVCRGDLHLSPFPAAAEAAAHHSLVHKCDGEADSLALVCWLSIQRQVDWITTATFFPDPGNTVNSATANSSENVRPCCVIGLTIAFALNSRVAENCVRGIQREEFKKKRLEKCAPRTSARSGCCWQTAYEK
jgi:hypothetical protein